MNGKELLAGMSFVHSKYVQEAEEMTAILKTEKTVRFWRKPLVLAALIGLMILLMGSAILAYVSMSTEPIKIVTPDGNIHEGEKVSFEEVNDVFIELGSYYPQEIPEGYSMVFVSDGAPYQNQSIEYENGEGNSISYQIYIADSASNVEVFDIVDKTDVSINGQAGILYEHGGHHRTLVWSNEKQGFGFALSTDDEDVDLLAMAKSTAEGEPLVPSRAEKTVEAVAELGNYSPEYLPDGFEEQGVQGSPISDGGGWYSYVRKWYINKTENTQIYFEYETYAIVTEDGYVDDAKTVCSFFIPGCDILKGIIVGEEVEIDGMYGIAAGNHIAWADPESHKVFHLTSEDIIGADLLKVAQSIHQNQ